MSADEARELRLLEAVELKLVLPDSADKLEAVLKVYICPMLLKLQSPHLPVRHKTLVLGKTIVARLDSFKEVVLPIDALVQQYQDAQSALLKVADLCFISLAVERLKTSPMLFLPLIVKGASLAGTEGQLQLTRTVVCILREDRPFDHAKAAVLPTELPQADQDWLVDTLERLLWLSHAAMNESMQPPANESTIYSSPPPNPAQLKAGKLNALHLLGSNIIRPEARCIAVHIATFDLHDDVRKLAQEVQRLHSPLVLEDTRVARGLYTLAGATESERRARSVPDQVKTLQLLSRSHTALELAEYAVPTLRSAFEQPRRVRDAALGYLQALALHARVKKTQLDTGTLVAELLHHWTDKADHKLLFQCLGLLLSDVDFAIQHPDSVRDLISQHYVVTDPETQLAADEALSGITFRRATPENKAKLMHTLQDYLTRSLEAGNTKFAAGLIKLLVRSFAFSDPLARILSILPLSSTSPELLIEAGIALDPYTFRLSNRMYDGDDMNFYNLPTVATMLTALEQRSGLIATERQRAAVYDFLRTLLYRECLPIDSFLSDVLAFKEDWHDALDTRLISDVSLRRELSRGLSEHDSLKVIVPQLLGQLLGSKSHAAGKWLVELLSLSSAFSRTSDPMQAVAGLRAVASPATDHGKLVCEAIALALRDPSVSDDIVREVLSRANQAFSQDRSADSAAYLAQLLRALAHTPRMPLVLELDLNPLKKHVDAGLESRNLLILRQSIDRFTDLAYAGLVTEPSGRIDLLQRLLKSQSNSLVDATLTATGYLAAAAHIGSDATSELVKAINELHTKDSLDVLLAAGETLSMLFARQQSLPMRRLMPDEVPTPGGDEALAAAYISESLLPGMAAPQRSRRKASTIWLLSLLQFLPEQSAALSAHLIKIHRSFLSVMADTDEFIADAATQGIQLVYVRADQATRDSLVTNIFSIFTSDSDAKASRGRVERDSEIFSGLSATAPASDGKENKKLSTFRDVCDLALDMGNNDMIYQFLSLSSANAMWSTRRGAALGISAMLDDNARRTVLNKDPKLYRRLLPKLFIYKHDPSKDVASSMGAMFDKLFPNEADALEQSFEIVLDELLAGINGQYERRREACCNAMTALLANGRIEKAHDRLEEIWQKAVRVLDDQQESVRTAAVALSKLLTKELLKTLEQKTSQPRDDRMLEVCLPMLFANLKSPSQDVSSFALETILAISKKAIRPLQPYLPALIEELLVMTTSLEPEFVNYLSFHAAKYNITQGQLDAARVSGVNGSPVLSAIEDCIDRLTADSIASTISRICTVVRSSQGLPTKAACARTIISICSRKAALIAPYADELLQALSGALTDSNETARAAYGAAAGYVSRHASTQKLVKLVNFLRKKYFASTDDSHEILLLSNLISGIATYAPDTFSRMHDTFMPLVFFGMHDADETNRGKFRSLWEQHTGSAATVRNFLPQVIDLIAEHISSPKWRVKRTAAATLAAVARATDLGDQLDRALELALSAMPGKVWTGKEEVLSAVAAVVKRGASRIDPERQKACILAVLAEAGRTQADYRRHALTHLASLLESCTQVDVYNEVLESLSPSLSNGISATGTTRDLDIDDERQKTPIKLVLLQRSIACIGAAYRSSGSSMEQDKRLSALSGLLAGVIESGPAWNVKSEVAKCVKRVVTTSDQLSSQNAFTLWKETIVPLITDSSYPSLREDAASTAAALATALALNDDTTIRQSIEHHMREIERAEGNSVVKAFLRKVHFV
ncbi:proteasome component M29 [Savitreella phatthalungensis]